MATVEAEMAASETMKTPRRPKRSPSAPSSMPPKGRAR